MQCYFLSFVGGFQRFNDLRKRNPSLKTLVAIGGWNQGSSRYSQVNCVLMFSMWYIAEYVTISLASNFCRYKEHSRKERAALGTCRCE
jgi:hypothetical protein